MATDLFTYLPAFLHTSSHFSPPSHPTGVTWASCLPATLRRRWRHDCGRPVASPLHVPALPSSTLSMLTGVTWASCLPATLRRRWRHDRRRRPVPTCGLSTFMVMQVWASTPATCTSPTTPQSERQAEGARGRGSNGRKDGCGGGRAGEEVWALTGEWDVFHPQHHRVSGGQRGQGAGEATVGRMGVEAEGQERRCGHCLGSGMYFISSTTE